MTQEMEEIKDAAELGKWLKDFREKRKITLEQIHMETKIRIKYLNAIESGDFSSIPGGSVYIKGFLRSYAAAVGLDPNSVVAQYKKVTKSDSAQSESIEQLSQEMPSKTHQMDTKRFSIFLTPPVILAAVTVLLIVGFLSFKISRPVQDTSPPPIKEDTHKTSETDTLAPPAPVTSANTPDGDAANDIKPPAVELVADTAGETAYVVDAEKIKVTLEVLSDRCWVSVKRDGSFEYEGTLKAGEARTWEAEDNLVIRAGKPKVIKFIVSGNDLGIPGGSTRNFVFKRRE